MAPAYWGLSGTVAAIKLSFVSVALWWVLFSIPLFHWVAEPPAPQPDPSGAARLNVFRQAARTLRELRGYRNAFWLLVAFLLYNDGIQTMIKMAAIYGAEIGIGRNAQIAAFVVVQFVGVPSSFLFGLLAGRVGAKPALYGALAIYIVISLIGYVMTSTAQFFLLAVLVGMVQGGAQALSRSMFARMIPPAKSSEYFGFFSVFEKFAGILGPATFAIAVALTGSSRPAVLLLVAFFVLGGLALTRVDLKAGEEQVAALRLTHGH